MRKLPSILVATNVVTLVLLGVVLREPAESPSAQTGPGMGQPTTVTVVRPQPAAESGLSAMDGQVFNWETVESADYREYIANLRRIGCPEETIQDIIKSDVKKLFAMRKSTVPKTQYEYWRTGNFLGDLLDEESVKAHQAQVEEQRALLRELLGTDVDLDDDAMSEVYNPLEAMLQFLPASKQTTLTQKRQTWQAEMMTHVGSGSPDAQDLANLKEVRDAMEAELTTLLSPEEKRKYDLRLSNTAQMMRLTLGDFDPTEQEFQDIFDLRKAFDDEHSVMGIPPVDDEGREARRVAAEQLQDDIKALLGPERYAEYERAPKREYQTALKIVERQGLDAKAAVDVYNMKGVAEAAAKILHGNNSITEADRMAALRAIRLETEQAIRDVLGPEGFESYNGQRGGRWIRELSPDP